MHAEEFTLLDALVTVTLFIPEDDGMSIETCRDNVSFVNFVHNCWFVLINL
jgi:hypothetical protein